MVRTLQRYKENIRNRYICNKLEINLEVPTELTDLVKNKTQELMTKAATAYLSTLTLDSDAEVSDHWVH